MMYLPKPMYLNDCFGSCEIFRGSGALKEKVDNFGIVLKVISDLWFLSDFLLSVHHDVNSLLSLCSQHHDALSMYMRIKQPWNEPSDTVSQIKLPSFLQVVLSGVWTQQWKETHG